MIRRLFTVSLVASLTLVVAGLLPHRAEAQLMTVAETCAKYGWNQGFMPPFSGKCYQNVLTSQTPSSPSLACTDGVSACCVDTANALHCPDRSVTFTPAVPESTAQPVSTSTTVKKPTDPITFTPELTIPGLLDGTWTIDASSIAEYIRVLFIGFVWSVGAIATVMVMYGGIKWVAAAGNPGRINDARDIINNAIIGIVIALSSVVLLNIINPNLTSFTGLNVKGIQKEYASLLVKATELTARCDAASVAGEPTIICTESTACSAAGSLNDWVNESADPALTSKWAGKPDPIMIKAIIAKESLLGGRPVSRATQVTDENGNAASSAYGIGQFVAGTLYQQLDRVRKRFGATMPSECTQVDLVDRHVVTPACRTWLDQIASPGNGAPVGLKAQVYMVSNYLGELSKAYCVNGDVGRNAVAYFLGPGDVQFFCDPNQIYGATPKKQAYLKKQLPLARDYLNDFSKFYKQYCDASS